MRLAIAALLIILLVLFAILVPRGCEGPEPIGPEPVGPESTTVQYDNSGPTPEPEPTQYKNSETLPPTGGPS